MPEISKEEKQKFINWLKTGGKKNIGTGDGGFLLPRKLPVPAKGFYAAFWRGLAGVYLFFGLYDSWRMTYIKGVYFVDTIEYLKERIEQRKRLAK